MNKVFIWNIYIKDGVWGDFDDNNNNGGGGSDNGFRLNGVDVDERGVGNATDNGGDTEGGFDNRGSNSASKEGNVDCDLIIDLDCDGGDDRKHGSVSNATHVDDDEVNDCNEIVDNFRMDCDDNGDGSRKNRVVSFSSLLGDEDIDIGLIYVNLLATTAFLSILLRLILLCFDFFFHGSYFGIFTTFLQMHGVII